MTATQPRRAGVARLGRLCLPYMFLLLICAPVLAQQYPLKPVRMVIHIGPGSSMDIVGRVLAQKMNEAWGQPAPPRHAGARATR